MIKQYLLSPVCIRCGSFFCEASLFCRNCFNSEIISRCQNQSPSHLGLSHYYLIEWKQNESACLDEMVYRMKSNYARRAWQYYAKIIYYKYCSEINFNKFEALVPVPGSKDSSVHSKIFCNELAKLTGLPVLDILIKNPDSPEQKKLGAQQRKSKLKIKKQNAVSVYFTKFIFVDDIVTTGASFNLSNAALGAGGENLIISLFYRSKTQ